jgi:hypothetical protein
MRTIKESIKPIERLLLVTSGGNLQTIDELASENFPPKLSNKDLEKIANCPHWSVASTLFRLTNKGLEKVSDNKQPGIYCWEHSSVVFDSTGSENKK